MKLKLAALITFLGVLACAESTGPESFGPRIVSVDAIACEITNKSLNDCLRNGFEIDPAKGDSAFHFTVMIPVFQNPPEDGWRLLTIWIDGEMSQTLPIQLATPDPATRTVTDTVVFTWLAPAHPTIEIEISMVEGDDPRFVEPVSDTLFVWRGRKAQGIQGTTTRQLVPGF